MHSFFRAVLAPVTIYLFLWVANDLVREELVSREDCEIDCPYFFANRRKDLNEISKRHI